MTEEQRSNLYAEIENDAQWLIRMVKNLLSITRIRDDNSGATVNKKAEAAEEVFAEAIEKFTKHHHDRRIDISIPDELVICPMDALLIEQVLINLFENAVEHGRGCINIGLEAIRTEKDLIVSVWNDGEEVSKETVKHLFQADSSGTLVNSDGKRNMGIGLSVCRTIIRAHGGTMHAEKRTGGGLCVRFSLPLEEYA